MANIALDIKANTTKALGEFKKLSRELDNKFLVQGLKLDVVKNAFRQINREFEQSLGSQGIAASESTGQIQRNAAAQLSLYSKLGSKAAIELTSATKKQLSELVAQGDLTKGVMQEALQLQGTLKFDGEDFGVKSKKLTKDIATLGQSFNDIFGNNQGLDALGKIATGSYGIEDLQNLDFGQGGAGANLIREALLKVSGGMFDSLTGADRTDALRRAVEMLNDESTELGNLRKQLEIEADQTKAFDFAIRDLTGIFSETGLFGILRKVGPQIKNFEGADVDRNVLQLSAKLISTLFDQKTGLFAVLLKTLGEAFGFDPKNAIEPILRGAELLISVFEGITDFIESSVFKNFLGIFKPFIDAIKGVEMPEKITAEDINKGVSKIFSGIRGLLSNLTKYISGIDTKTIGDMVGNFLGEFINTLPGIIDVVFASIFKAIDFLVNLLSSEGTQKADIGAVFAKVINGLAELIGKVIGLVVAAAPKLLETLASSITKLDAGGLALVGVALSEGITRLFTGKGILGNVGDFINKRLARATKNIPIIGDFFERRANAGENKRAARGSDKDRWGLLFEKLDTIIRCVCKNGILDLLGNRPGRGRPRLPGNSRLRTPRLPGARPRLPNLPRLPGSPRLPRLPGFSPRVTSNVTPRLPGTTSRFTPPGVPRLPRPTVTTIPRGSVTGNVIDVTPIGVGSRAATRGPISSAGNLLKNIRQSASSLASSAKAQARVVTSPISRAAGSIGSRLPGLPKLPRIPGGKGGLIGALFGGLAIADILGSGAQGAELDALSDEEKRAQKRGKTKGVLGVLGGIGGGALAGAGVGAALGAAGANPFTVAVGGVLGSIIGGIIGEEAVKVLGDDIIDGVMDFAGSVGGWFSDTWSNISGGWNSATGAIGDFFGKEGPIQKFGKFAGDNVKGGVENIQKFFGEEGPIATVANWFKELPGKVAETIQKAGQDMFDGITGAVGGFTTELLRNAGLGDLADKIEGRDKQPPTPNFAGGFNVLGGRTSFNEYEAIGMPDGVTYIPITSSTSLDGIMGGSSRGETTNNLEVTVNVTGSDPQAIATEVIAEIDKIYNSVNV